MTAFTQFPHSEQQNSCIVENLTPFDILVCDKSWQQREFLTLDEHRMLWAIITAWQQKDIGAVEALAMLDNSELLDPDALMMGFSAFHTAMAQRPPLPPTPPLSPAPSGALRPSCAACNDTGHVCESQPDREWDCRGAGMPCPRCCSIPEYGTGSISNAFVPDHLRSAPSVRCAPSDEILEVLASGRAA